MQAREQGKEVRALVVINPGNPTGGVLSKANQVRTPPPSTTQDTRRWLHAACQARHYRVDQLTDTYMQLAKHGGESSCRPTASARHAGCTVQPSSAG